MAITFGLKGRKRPGSTWHDESDEELYAARQRIVELERALTRATHDSPQVDVATGLGNTAQLWHEGNKAIARFNRTGHEFAVVLLVSERALDGADGVFAEVAELLSMTCRAEDCPCYVGGIYFAVLLTGTNDEGARVFLERARRGPEWQPGTPAAGLLLHGGVASWKAGYADFDELLSEAKKDLARRLRDNRVNRTTWNKAASKQ